MPVVFLGGILLNLHALKKIRRYIGVILLASALMHMGSFEWIREEARRPYVIYNYMYSNSIPKDASEHIKNKGF